MALYLVERDFDPPASVEHFLEEEPRFRFCLESWRVELVETFVSNDGRRVICIFDAPDAESVAEVNRRSGLPFTAIRRVELHPAHSSADVTACARRA